MGADYSAYVVVGVRVKASKLYAKKRIKAFEHNHPEDWDVDPKTGKKLWRTEKTFRLGDDVTDDDYDWRSGRAKGARATVVRPSCGDSDSEYAYVTRHVAKIGLEGDDREASIKGVDLEAEKKFLHELLDPHGLWSEEGFGIWLAGDVSC